MKTLKIAVAALAVLGSWHVADASAQGRIVSVLEGGYHPRALSRSVEAHLRALGEGA